MATTTTLVSGSVSSVLGTELNSLANNAQAISAAYTAGGGYVMAEVELYVSYGSAPTASTGCTVWFLRAIDDTNYEDGDASVTPGRLPDAVFPLRAVNTAQRITRRVLIPPGTFKVLLRNDGTGQAMAASSNTLKIKPVTYQGN